MSGSQVLWSGGASNPWLLAIGAVLLAQAIALQALLPELGALPVWLAIHVLVLAVLELFSRIRVTVDDRGLTIRYGHLGWWRRRVPLEQIAATRAVKLDALQHGGWGYRGSLWLLGKAAVVVRSGDAVRLELQGGRLLFITVDEAAEASSVLGELVARTRGRPALTRSG